eukprot:TRINITY_DN11975_c0_g1_i1.p1 TRINITY_DN11975_c0_g1~~TRINITY_DN11975_c0_g1_i1.p1  ORF type:complete len:106 (-),score=37.75 TRINITY_DN11975_c0_g1_i1:130-447(-)
MSKKKEVQVQITSDAHWREILKEGGYFLLEVYSEKWGQCVCFKGTIQKFFYSYMDCCKFYAAPTDKVKALNEFECIEPVFILYNCLLYTSPSPRDRTRSRMPSSA